MAYDVICRITVYFYRILDEYRTRTLIIRIRQN